MNEPRFFPEPDSISLSEIATLTGAVLADPTQASERVTGVSPLDRAKSGDITYFETRRLLEALEGTKALACFISEANALLAPRSTVLLITPSPERAFAELCGHLYPASIKPEPATGTVGVSGQASVSESALLERGVTVEPSAVIGAGAEVGQNTVVCAGAVIGKDVRIGRDCYVGPGVTITHSLIGNRVAIHAGARIGQDGFGYVPGAEGHLKIPQIGRVIIQDDVEIGANTTIDRGSVRDTIVGEGTKIDNQVQIAHNVRIGRHCIVAGQAGLSGSVTLGDFVMMGGNAGVKDHVTVGSGVRIAAAAAVHNNVPAGETWGGYPALRVDKWYSQMRILQRIVRRAANEKKTGEPEEN